LKGTLVKDSADKTGYTLHVTSGLHSDVEDIFALLGCYAEFSGEDGIDWLSRNVGKDLILYAM
jgi:hypothetical protein